MDEKRVLVIAGVAIIALLLVVPMAYAAPGGSATTILLTYIKNKVDELGQMLWSQANSVKNDTQLIHPVLDTLIAMNSTVNSIQGNLNQEIKIVTKSGNATFPSGTEAMPYYWIMDIYVVGPVAADFSIAINVDGDFTPSDGDRLTIYQGIGPYGCYQGCGWMGVFLWVDDTGLATDGPWNVDFTGTEMAIVIETAATLTDPIEIWYSYTVTTNAGVDVFELV